MIDDTEIALVTLVLTRAFGLKRLFRLVDPTPPLAGTQWGFEETNLVGQTVYCIHNSVCNALFLCCAYLLLICFNNQKNAVLMIL